MPRVFRFTVVLLAFLIERADLIAAEPLWNAGIAKCVITPAEGLWLAGYGGRDKPAESKVMELWIKVLALEDTHGRRALILTSDTLGIPQSIYGNISAALKQQFGLEREQVMLTASHTHCGPVLRHALWDMYPLDDHQRSLIEVYSADLEAKIVSTIGRAIADLAPARLVAGQGMSGFAVNRRNNPEGAVPKLIAEGGLKGPVDHSVPVLAVTTPEGNCGPYYSATPATTP